MSAAELTINAADRKPAGRSWFAVQTEARNIIASMVLSARAEASVLGKSENPDAEKLDEIKARIALYEKESEEVIDGCLETQRRVIAEYGPVYRHNNRRIGTV